MSAVRTWHLIRIFSITEPSTSPIEPSSLTGTCIFSIRPGSTHRSRTDMSDYEHTVSAAPASSSGRYIRVDGVEFPRTPR